jgi:predicted exporter
MPVPRNNWSEHRRRRFINGAFALALVLLLLALVQILRSGLVIDTSLRSLAPDISQDALSETLINDLSSVASRKATVVLAADTSEQVAAASERLRARLAELEIAGYLVKQADPAETAASYVRLLEEYPYNFLRPSLAAVLADKDDAQLTQWVLEQFYGSAGQVRLTRFDRDPFGALNDYVIYLQEHLAGDQTDDIQTMQHQGAQRFFTVWQFELPEDGLALNTQAEWIAQLEAIRADLQTQFAAVEWLQSGVIFFAADSARATQRNINVISGVGITGIVLMMLLVFRGARPLAASVLAITGGVLFAFAICHSLWGSIHILTLLFGASLIGVAVDYSLHLYYFRFATPAVGANAKTHFYPALLLSLLTSIVGYSALAMSGLETLQQVAVFSIAGLSFACVWVLFSEPWAVKNLRIKDAGLARITSACVHWLRPLARVRLMVAANVLLWLSLLVFAGWFVFDDSPRAFITQNPVLLENEQRLSQWLGEYEPATFILVHGANEAEVFGKIHHLRDFLSTSPDILHGAKKDLLGIHTLLPSPEQQLQYQQLNASFYREALQQALTATYEILEADQFAELHEQYRQQQGRVLTPQALMQRLPGFPRLWQEQETATGERRIVTALLIPKNADLKQLRTAVDALGDTQWVSLMDETRSGLQHLRTTASYYLGFALLLIGGIFIWRYGVRRGLVISLIPVAVIGVICLVYLLAQTPVTLFHVMAAFLVVGLGVDYHVFVAEMSGKEESRYFANALMLSAATSSLSFGLLSLSVLPAVSAFGTTVMLGILGNLIGGFCLVSVWPTLKGKIDDN